MLNKSRACSDLSKSLLKDNSLTKKFSLLKTSPKVSTPETNGQNANLYSKSEIKPTVDHAGLWELPKPCLTESVLPLDKNSKPEFPPKI